MAVIYEDQHVICDDDAITINVYYFPIGSKRIPYSSIRRIEEYQMGYLTGKLRIWGTSFPTYWFHLDYQRPNKEFAIIIDTGSFVKAVITPDNHQLVYSILLQKIRPKRYLRAVTALEKI